MEILPSTRYKSLKTYWRKKSYQKVSGTATATHNKMIKLQNLSLSEESTSTAAAPRQRRLWRMRRTPKLRLKIASPVRFLAKFHEAYVDLMTYVGKKIPKPNTIQGGFLPYVFVTGREISFVPAASRHLEVDSKLVQEIYENLGASRRIKY